MIVPSVDLQDKKAVQLKQGKDKMLENSDPVGLAGEFNFFSEIAVIDLDAAIRTDGLNNEDVISEIAAISDCRVGGGIRSAAKAEKIIKLGATKVIIGTGAFRDGRLNTSFLDDLKSSVGKDHIILAVDTYEGEIVTHGWKKKTGIMLSEIASGLEDYASELLFTCVEKEGMLQGADLGRIRSLKEKTSLDITAAGGISTLDEISTLSEMGCSCQLGMSIYTGKISLEDALFHSICWDHDKIPVTVMSGASEIIFSGWTSRKYFRETLKDRKCRIIDEIGDRLDIHAESTIKKIRNSRLNDSVTITLS